MTEVLDNVKKTKLRILFIPHELSDYNLAKATSYTSQFALEEGFQFNDIDFVTIPSAYGYFTSEKNSWLSRIKTLLKGDTFDQVWISLVHTPYEDDFLEWLKTIAPIRVGLVVESLEYSIEECRENGHFIYRRSFTEHQLRAMTHALMVDEHDVDRANKMGFVKALWWPSAIPARVIKKPLIKDKKLPAVFYGSLYRKRHFILQHESLRHLLVCAVSLEQQTDIPKMFNELHLYTRNILLSEEDITMQHLDNYLMCLRNIRRAAFELWMSGLPNATAQLNLPSFVKTYASRVVESMAAGCPVIAWDIPNRPRNRNLFCEGEEILFFGSHDPDAIASHIRHLQQEPEWALQLAERAQDKVIRFHTTEKRVAQVLDWIATEKNPEYGERVVTENEYI